MNVSNYVALEDFQLMIFGMTNCGFGAVLVKDFSSKFWTLSTNPWVYPLALGAISTRQSSGKKHPIVFLDFIKVLLKERESFYYFV